MSFGDALAGIGAFAGGGARGYLLGREDARQQADADFAKGQRERLVKQQATADADAALMRDANAQGAKVLQTYKEQYEGPRAATLLGGGTTEGSNTYRPNEDQLLEAAQSRTNYLFDKGRTDLAVHQWVQDEGLRSQMRQRAMQQGMLAYKASGDPTQLISGVYKNIDDGWNLKAVTPQATEAGITGWNVSRVNPRTGEEKVDTIPADKIDGLMQWATDPKEVAKYALMSKLEGVKGEEQRKTKGVEHQYNLLEGQDKGRIKLGEIAAEGQQHQATERVKGQEHRLTDAERIKAEGGVKKKKDARYDQLHDEIVRAVGEPAQGILGGNRIGTEQTQAAASYADALMEANPDMSVADAVRSAIGEMKKRQAPKK